MKSNAITITAILAAAVASGAVEKPHDDPPPGFELRDWQRKHMPPPLETRFRQVAAVQEGELRLTPTFVSCSVVWGAAISDRVAEFEAH